MVNHYLYHAAIELYRAEMQRDADDREIIPNDVFEKWTTQDGTLKPDALEYEDLTEEQVSQFFFVGFEIS